MAVVAKALLLALISAASAADSADCGAEDATSLIQKKSTLEPGGQNKVVAKDEDKAICIDPKTPWQGMSDRHHSDHTIAQHQAAAGYEQCLRNNCEDATEPMVFYWANGNAKSCKSLVRDAGCDYNGENDYDADGNGIFFKEGDDMAVWKMCGATCKEQCNAARLEKKAEPSPNVDISESLVDKVMSCASNCEDKTGQENYIHDCRQECFDGVEELAAAKQTARVVKMAEFCGDEYKKNIMHLTGIFKCCRDKFPRNGNFEHDEWQECVDVLKVIRAR